MLTNSIFILEYFCKSQVDTTNNNNKYLQQAKKSFTFLCNVKLSALSASNINLLEIAILLLRVESHGAFYITHLVDYIHIHLQQTYGVLKGKKSIKLAFNEI